VIVADGLTKVYRVRSLKPGVWGALSGLWSREVEEVHALDDVSFEVPTGSCTAYLGANGAGKSTTIKILSGVLTPTSGRCSVGGRDPRQERRTVARETGIVFGHRSQLWWDLPVADSFRILARIYEIPADREKANLALFDEVLSLGELAGRPVRTLSLGQRMRAEIAAALFHDPRLLLLDEPTIGLDLLLKDAVHELVNRVVTERGTTVLLASHDIGDITALCTNAVVLDRGGLVYDGDLTSLLRSAPTRTVRIDHSGDIPAERLVAAVEAVDGRVRCTVQGRRRLEIVGPASAVTPQRILHALSDLVTITDLVAPEPTLGEVLRTLYRHDPVEFETPGTAR
jgi:ABC-2 type transport system ATP-binding protein